MDSRETYEAPADPLPVTSATAALGVIKTGPFFDGAGYTSIPV